VHTISESHTDNDDLGLNTDTTSDGLRSAFVKYGKVIRGMSLKFELYILHRHCTLRFSFLYLIAAEVVTDPDTGLSEGIGFVRYAKVTNVKGIRKNFYGQVSFLIILMILFLWISKCLH
jgi:RNA recognition motif-containing protein